MPAKPDASGTPSPSLEEVSDRPVICIFGSYAPKPGERLYEQAYAVGYALADAGFTVANGGYAGTMTASAKGAKDAGGKTIGVTCSVFTRGGQPLKANPYIDREIACDNVLDRINQMVQMSAGFVILEGGTGTLSELGIVWEYVAKGFIPPSPIFILGDFWQPVVDRVSSVRPKHSRHIHRVGTPEEIVAIAAKTIAGRLC